MLKPNSNYFQKQNFKTDWAWLLCWILIGASLRFYNLESKPPWADEWATLVFSLGHSFRTIPLDKIIDLNTLLLPLHLDTIASPQAVVNNLMRESTHPPLYFVLTNFWLKLLDNSSGLVSLWLARALTALLGVVAIPAIFVLAYLLFRFRLTSHLAAALMAVSPYGIYLAQETRHYTLAILWVMASLACAIVVMRNLRQKTTPPLWLILLWIIINSLAVATHYFVGLMLISELIVLTGIYWQDFGKSSIKNFRLQLPKPWRRVIWAVLGTLAGCSIWLWTWLTIPSDRLTDWVDQSDRGLELFEPIGRLIAWLITMFLLLPIEGVPTWIIIISAAILLFVLCWLILTFVRSPKEKPNLIDDIDSEAIINRIAIASIILVLICTYLLQQDLTLAARFQFFYFPVVILALAAKLARIWNNYNSYLIIAILFVGFCGSLSVIHNFAYQKPDQPDLVVTAIAASQKLAPTTPILIATVHKTHEQTGEMIGIAWEWQKLTPKPAKYPKFLLLHKEQAAEIVTTHLHQQIDRLPRPLDVWIVNFSAPAELETKNCAIDRDFTDRVPGYRYRLYHCL
jgi:uncharacterized membrane protein